MDSRLPMTYGAIEDPVTLEERAELARFTSKTLGFTMPSVVDGIDDTVNMDYQAWPERLYLVDAGGKILFRCGPGPFGFDPDGLETAIQEHLAE